MNQPHALTLEDMLITQDNAARAPKKRRAKKAEPAATPNQVSFARNLVAEKCEGDLADVPAEPIAAMTKTQASDFIGALLGGVKKMRVNRASNGVSIPAGPPATDKQRAFVKRLIDQKGATDIDVDSLTKSSASDVIEDLLARPNNSGGSKPSSGGNDFLRVEDFPEILPSSYAVTGADGTTDFYVVQHGKANSKWAGTLFVKLHVSGRDDQNLRGANARTIAEKIMSDGPRAAAIRYGKELGECARCHRELTNNDSIKAGIGPVCAQNAGW